MREQYYSNEERSHAFYFLHKQYTHHLMID